METPPFRSAGDLPEQRGRRRRVGLMLVAVFGLALLVRVVYLIDSLDNPTFYAPTNDALSYHTFAAGLAQTGTPPPNFFFQPFLYPYLLSQVYRVGGISIWTAKVVQAILGALTCVLTAWLARRTFGAASGWVAGVAAAVCGPLVFFEGELLGTGLEALVGLLLVLTMLWTGSEPRRWWAWAAVGVCGAASVLLRPTFLPFVVVGTAWLLYAVLRTAGWQAFLRRVAPASLAAAAGFAILALPAALAVQRNDGQFTIFPSSGALNLYLGNHPDTEYALSIRPGYAWEYLLFEPTRADPYLRSYNRISLMAG
ncbi:MAG: glycosyltransferase family 39 protein [Phycisphaerae bacterium]